MMDADKSIIESVKDMELIEVGNTHFQKTHREDSPHVSDDSQDKDMENKMEEQISNKEKNGSSDLKE